MPGTIVTELTPVQCAHLGKGTPVVPNPRVKILGMSVVTISTQYTIAPCQAPAMSGGNLPVCTNGSFTTASTRVLSNTGFVLLADSQGTSIPNGTPMVILPGQTRVIAI